MDFTAAVKALVEAHTSEVRALQRKISCLSDARNASENGTYYLQDQKSYAWRGSERPSIQSPTLLKCRHAEHHLVPLMTPGITGASNSKGDSAIDSIPQKSPVLVTPTAWMIPFTPHDRWSPYVSEASQQHSFLGTMVNGTTKSSFENGRGSSLLNKSDLEEHFDIGGSTSTCGLSDIDATADWMHRWVLLADGVLHNRDFVVHPGWTPESYVRESETEDAFGASKSSQHGVAVTFSVNTSQKAALAKQERQMMCERSRSQALLGSRPARRRRAHASSASSVAGFSSMFILHPASPFRRFWVFLCVWVITYEVFALTMEPFDVIPRNVEKTIEWIFLSYWSLDILVNFFSGIYVDGKVEKRLCKIAVNYLRTWFAFDITVVLSQAFPLLLDTGDIGAAAVFRIMRCLRSLRLARVFYWLKDEFGLSSSVIAGGKFLQFFLCLIFFLHCSACLWYEVGKADDGWTTRYKEELGSSTGLRYLASLHWALAQMQGNTNIYPGATLGDRIFVVISSYASILVLTFFVSSMTDILLSERVRRKNQIDEDRLVIRFFGRHDINPEVCARAEHYLQLKKKQQNWMEGNEQDNKVLTMFPAPLRAILLAEMRAFCLTWHPIFAYLQKYHRSLFVKVCSKVLANHTYEPNDDVFTYGEVGSHAFHILKGDFVFNAKFDLLSTVAPWIGERAKRTRFSNDGRMNTTISLTTSVEAISGWLPQARGGSSSGFPRNSKLSAKSYSAESLDNYENNGENTMETNGAHVCGDDTERFVKHNRPVRRLKHANTVSEVSLWLAWVHAGDLCSLEYGEAMLISNSELVALLTNHPNDHAIFSSYATRFSKAAKKIRQANNTDQLIELMGFQAVWEVEQELARAERARERLRDTFGPLRGTGFRGSAARFSADLTISESALKQEAFGKAA